MAMVHGRSCSWSNIELKASGGLYISGGFTAVDFGEDKLTEELGYGMSARPQRRSAGRYEPAPIKLTAYRNDAQLLLASAAARSTSGKNFSQFEFTLTVSYAYLDTEPVNLDVAERCRIISVSKAYAEGPELLLTDLQLQPMAVYHNGVGLFEDESTRF